MAMRIRSAEPRHSVKSVVRIEGQNRRSVLSDVGHHWLGSKQCFFYPEARLENTQYSLSIVKKIIEGKQRWTLVRTDGEPTDIGVVLEEGETPVQGSGVTTNKPTKIVTPNESAVIFQTQLRKVAYNTRLRIVLAFSLFILQFLLTMLLIFYVEGFEEWYNGLFAFGLFALCFLPLPAGYFSRSPVYDVADGSGSNLGVITKDRKVSLLRPTFVIETQFGRWKLTETSSASLVRKLPFVFGLGCGLASFLGPFSGTSAYIAAALGPLLVKAVRMLRKRGYFSSFPALSHRLTLRDERRTQVGHFDSTSDEDGKTYYMHVQDSRLDQRMVAAAGFITADSVYVEEIS